LLKNIYILGREELEKEKSEFENKKRELEDLSEIHLTTLNIYKQK